MHNGYRPDSSSACAKDSPSQWLWLQHLRNLQPHLSDSTRHQKVKSHMILTLVSRCGIRQFLSTAIAYLVIRTWITGNPIYVTSLHSISHITHHNTHPYVAPLVAIIVFLSIHTPSLSCIRANLCE